MAIASVIFLGLCVSGVFSNEQVGRKLKDEQSYVLKTSGAPWPQPKSMTSSLTQRTLNAEFFLFRAKSVSDPKQCDILDESFAKYRQYIFGRDVDSLKFRPKSSNILKIDPALLTLTPLESLTITVQGDCNGYPALGSDESCMFYFIN